MSEDLESLNDFEYSSECGMLEEEVDKLNDLTFGNEITWNSNNTNIENDDTNFERFQFDESESNENIDNKSQNDKSKSYVDDLLGLKGSFFNFGMFKSATRETSNDHKDEDFEMALGKLNLLDTGIAKKSTPDFIDSVKIGESPFVALTTFSEELFAQFLGHQKNNSNSQFLNTVVAKHLNMLSKKLVQLSLPMDVLAQLRYFRMLTTFVTVDNRINEIRTRCSSDQRMYNAEMAALVQHFAQHSPQQQADLSLIHPFFSNVLECFRSHLPLAHTMEPLRSMENIQGSLQHRGPSASITQEPTRYQVPLRVRQSIRDHQETMANPSCTFEAPNEGRWMSASEREWMTKVQTRSLVPDNPYVHDYYYTSLKFKEMCHARSAQLAATGHTTLPDPISLLPSPISADQLGAGVDLYKDGLVPQYHPVQFENSLGLVTTSNLNTPRHTIQVPQRHKISMVTDTSQDPYKLVRKHRELLGIIEKLYCTVLRVDEVDKSLAKMLVDQHPNRGVLLQHRSYLLKILMDCVNTNVRFVQMFSVSKGVRILASVMAIVTSVQFIQLMRTFFFNCLSIWESDCFEEMEFDFRSIIVLRIRKLIKDELSLLITTFFCNLTPKSFNDKIKLQPLSGFCRSEFGLYVVFTVLDSFFNLSPEDKLNINQLVVVAARCSDSQTAIQKVVTEFQALFPTANK